MGNIRRLEDFLLLVIDSLSLYRLLLSVFDVFLLAVPLGSGVHSVPHTLIMSMNLKCYEYEIIKPITSNCPNTDMLSTNMSKLHTMTSTQISTQLSEPLLVLLTAIGLN